MTLIVADVGGTNARFAVSSQNDPSLHHVTYLRCADFESFEDACESFLAPLRETGNRGPPAFRLAVAGLVTASQDKSVFQHRCAA